MPDGLPFAIIDMLPDMDAIRQHYGKGYHLNPDAQWAVAALWGITPEMDAISEHGGLSVEQITSHQLVPELAAGIADSNATHVVFVDTAPAAISHEIQIRPLDAPQATLTLGHQCSPDLLIYMAHQLYGVQVPAWLVTIPGADFGHGERLSSGVEELLAESDCIAMTILGQ